MPRRACCQATSTAGSCAMRRGRWCRSRPSRIPNGPMARLAAKLPPGFTHAWSGLSYEERQSSGQAPLLYALSLLVVFLCLAALYESWSVPFAVILVVPLGVFGALLAASGRGLSNDVYFQVALLATIGLSSRNAILIVEFAKEQMERE